VSANLAGTPAILERPARPPEALQIT